MGNKMYAVEREMERLVGEGLQYKTDAEVWQKYDGKFKLLENGLVEIKLYYDYIQKKKEGFEDLKTDFFRAGRKQSRDSGDIRADSLSRTREKLIDYACMHEKEWKSFITLTIADATVDITQANKYFQNFIYSWKRKKPDLMYLGVPEYQERGAVHYHLLTNVECGSELIPAREELKLYNKDTKKWTVLNYYDLKHWNQEKLGFSSAFDFKVTDEKFNVALYITKYLYKDISNRLFGHNKILKSNNLRKPDVLELKHTSACYINALDYLEQKGYNLDVKSFVSNKPYVVPFDLVKVKLEKSDLIYFSSIVKDDLPF